jgi:hypothetical protein
VPKDQAAKRAAVIAAYGAVGIPRT